MAVEKLSSVGIPSKAKSKRAVIYTRVFTIDQHPETQLYDLREMAKQRGYEIVGKYSDKISGSKQKRPGLDQLMADARRHKFDTVLVWAFDRMARSVRHFLEILDELNQLGVEFVSFRENIYTGGPLGRAMIVIVGAIAELEKNLIVERVRAGMRRARLEGRQIGPSPLKIDRTQLIDDPIWHVIKSGREETPGVQGHCVPLNEGAVERFARIPLRAWLSRLGAVSRPPVAGISLAFSSITLFFRLPLPVQTVDATSRWSFDLAIRFKWTELWVAVRFYLNRTPFLCFWLADGS